MDIQSMKENERLHIASKLGLRAIAQDKLLTKKMWMEHTGARYSVKVKAELFSCVTCGIPWLRTNRNFSMDRRSIDNLSNSCKPCGRTRAATYREKAKVRLENGKQNVSSTDNG